MDFLFYEWGHWGFTKERAHWGIRERWLGASDTRGAYCRTTANPLNKSSFWNVTVTYWALTSEAPQGVMMEAWKSRDTPAAWGMKPVRRSRRLGWLAFRREIVHPVQACPGSQITCIFSCSDILFHHIVKSLLSLKLGWMNIRRIAPRRGSSFNDCFMFIY